MAIDAVVTAVEWNLDGTAVMRLGPRMEDDGSYSLTGQDSLLVLNPPKYFDAIVETPVWGNTKALYVGRRQIANRVGWNAIRLLGRTKP